MASTSASTESVLVTLACPHFAVFPASPYRVFSRAVAQEQKTNWKVLLLTYSRTQLSLNALWKFCPTVLISMQATCGRAECSNHPESHRVEHEKILVGLKCFWDTRRAVYLQLGEEYFVTLPILPASAINGSTCLTAHQQFVIESRHWTVDPFFDSWKEAATALYVTAAGAGHSPDATIRDAIKYLVRGMSDFLQLNSDVLRLRQLVKEPAAGSNITAPDRLKRSHFLVHCDNMHPKHAFSNVARKRYEERMVGFEFFGASLAFDPANQR